MRDDPRGEPVGPRHPEPGRGPLRSAAAKAWSRLSTLVSAVALALLVRTFVVETFYVPSESMLPTLLVGDHMLVEKFSFGARIPFTEIEIPPLREPKRGEIVTFRLGRDDDGDLCPLDRCPGSRRENFVKRIVAVPGDRIEILGGRIELNGRRVPLEATGESLLDSAGEPLLLGLESLGESPHSVADHPRRQTLNQVRITIPEGRYYLLGDNRDNSNDSRVWGTIRRSDIIGPVTFLYWSWNNRGSWWSMLSPATWVRLLRDEMRWDRIGTSVQ